jgi:putative transposase
MLTWAHARSVQLFLIEPGKPNQNAYIESFNGRFRDECLNEHWFTSMRHARSLSKLAAGIQRGTTKEILGGLTPAAYAKTLTQKSLNYPRTLKPTATENGGTSFRGR